MEKLINEVKTAAEKAEEAMNRLTPIEVKVRMRKDASYCPLCKVGDYDSHRIMLCVNCAIKLQTNNN